MGRSYAVMQGAAHGITSPASPERQPGQRPQGRQLLRRVPAGAWTTRGSSSATFDYAPGSSAAASRSLYWRGYYISGIEALNKEWKTKYALESCQ